MNNHDRVRASMVTPGNGATGHPAQRGYAGLDERARDFNRRPSAADAIPVRTAQDNDDGVFGKR